MSRLIAILISSADVSSVVNCLLVIGAAVAINRSETGASGDQALASIENDAKSISDRVGDVLDMVARQIKASLKLLETLQHLQSDKDSH
jgi:hypothetical protein